MAKRKHSTALFEVITTSRRYTRPQPAATGPAPGSWWFNRRAKAQARAEGGTSDQAPQRQIAAPTRETARENGRPDRASAVPATIETQWGEEPAREHEEQAEAQHDEYRQHGAPLSEEYGQAATSLGVDENDILEMPRAQSVAVSVDSDRRQIALRMSYTAAIIGGFSVLVLVGLAIIVGQHMTRNGAPLLAQTTSRALQASPAHREIMDVPRQTFNNPNVIRQEPRPAGQTAVGDPQPGPTTSVEAKRQIGLNYVIVQGYAAKEEDMAVKAAAFLNTHGIACTVEKDVKGYSAVTVVGLRGFDRQTSPDIKTYVQKIQDLSGEYTINSRGYKAFTPLIKKWDKTN